MLKPIKSIIDDTLPFASEARSRQGDDTFTAAFNTWKADDTPATRGQLLRQAQPVIDTALHSYAGTAGQSLKPRAKLLALNAFKTYDPTKGTLQTHLLSQLQGLRRIGAQSAQIISIPERVVLERQQLTQASDELQNELGREPSDMELAAKTGLSLKRINYIRQAKPGTNTGSILDDEGEVFTPGSVIPGNQSAADSWAEMIYYDLTDIDRKIMEHTLGLHGAPVLSNNELASKLNLSPGAISQRKAKIQQLLDDQYTVDPFRS